jgi:hypothetical protein
LHTGVVPPQSELPTQPTHEPAAVSQTAVVPEHFVLLVAEQTPHEPPGWQAGVAPPHSRSPAQPRQVCVVRLQTGVAPPQSALPTHPTHVPVEVRHAAVAPPQASSFVAEHWPQAPLPWHAGVAPPHWPSFAQP